MTFEQWWASQSGNKFQALFYDVDKGVKPAFAECWNAALEAVLKTDAIINASSREVEEVETLKVTQIS